MEQRKNKYLRVLDVPPTDLSIPAGSRSPSELFMALNDEEISRQLTLIDFQLFQVIEVRIVDGSLSIRSHPATEDLFVDADQSQEGAEVRRTFEFPDGIPAEYAWINGPDIEHSGVRWLQYFENVHLWRAHVEREAATTPGHSASSFRA